MTFRISKSAIAGIEDFPAVAAAHAVEMKSWRAHMERVRADEAGGVAGIDKHWPIKRPTAHPLVEAAVNENDEMDYELVDDDPSPDQILRARKDSLLQEVYRREQMAIAKVTPIGKRRLLNLRENAVMEAHAARVREQSGGVLKTIAAKAGLSKPPEMPEEDARLLEAQAERRELVARIEAAAAQAMHDVEDLTLETAAAWQLPDFSKT